MRAILKVWKDKVRKEGGFIGYPHQKFNQVLSIQTSTTIGAWNLPPIWQIRTEPPTNQPTTRADRRTWGVIGKTHPQKKTLHKSVPPWRLCHVSAHIFYIQIYYSPLSPFFPENFAHTHTRGVVVRWYRMMMLMRKGVVTHGSHLFIMGCKRGRVK